MKTVYSLTFTLVITLMITGKVNAQNSDKAKYDKNAFMANVNQMIKAIETRDLNLFAATYADSILYSDPAYGASGIFLNSQLKKMFEGIFSQDSEYKIDITTKAMDVETKTLMLLLSITYPDETTNEYAGWMKFYNGKIVEQIDFVTYRVDELLKAPRFTKYFGDENLEIRKIQTKN